MSLVFLLFLIAIPTLVFSQENSNAPVNQKSWTTYQSDIAKLWKIQNEFLARGESDTSQFFNQILFLKENYEVDQIPFLSDALLRKIPPQKTLNDQIRHPLYEMSTKLSPNYYENDYYLCKFHMDPAEWLSTIKSCFQGFSKQMEDPGAYLIFLSKLSSQAYWTIVLMLTAFTTLYICKFSPFLTQYYSSRFYWISPIGFIYIIMIISILVLFTLGWLCFFMLIYIAIWRFPSIKEKFVLLILAGLIACLPWTLTAPTFAKQYYKSILYDLIQVEKSMQPQRSMDRIRDYITLHPRDTFALFTLGRLEKKVGNLENARNYFEQSLQSKPDFVKAMLNLANVKYELGDSSGAKEDYKKIIATLPNYVPPYMNISQIYTFESQYLEGEKYLNIAKEKDTKKFQMLYELLHLKKGYVRLLYDDIDRDNISEVLYKRGETFQFYFQQFFSNYFPRHSLKIFYYKIVFMIVFSLLFQFFTHTRNFFVLYDTREKNYERLTLIQLKDYPHAYKKFAASLDLRDRWMLRAGYLLPGFWAFIEEQVFLSLLLTLLFLFGITGIWLGKDAFEINGGFPWIFVYSMLTCMVFVGNAIYVKVVHGKKKDKE